MVLESRVKLKQNSEVLIFPWHLKSRKKVALNLEVPRGGESKGEAGAYGFTLSVVEASSSHLAHLPEPQVSIGGGGIPRLWPPRGCPLLLPTGARGPGTARATPAAAEASCSERCSPCKGKTQVCEQNTVLAWFLELSKQMWSLLAKRTSLQPGG